MSPMPTQMLDRWTSRTEPTYERGTVYWHMLVGNSPEARAAAREAQSKLASFSGFHMTPEKWLHITTLIAGSTDEISSVQLQEMVASAQEILSEFDPVRVNLGRILYHPEALMLAVQPTEALLPVLEAARAATLQVTGRAGQTNGSLPSWTPHVTVSYSTADQDAAPIVDALGLRVQAREVEIGSLSLVVQWGPERLWNWEPVGSISFGRNCSSEVGERDRRDGTRSFEGRENLGRRS